MRAVIDTNVLFSFFWKESGIRKTILDPKLELFAPEKALDELDDHSSEICSKAGINLGKYDLWRTVLSWEINEVKFEEFEEKLSEARRISPHPKDEEFFAVALLLGSVIWSNEDKLKQQSKVKVLSNKEMLKKFGFS